MKELIKQADTYEQVLDSLTKYANSDANFGKERTFVYDHQSYKIYQLMGNNCIELFMQPSIEAIKYIQENELPEDIFELRETLHSLGLSRTPKAYYDVQPN